MCLEERSRIEECTREQSLEKEWYHVRLKRITGSKCGRIICQCKKTVSLLQQCLYPKPLVPLPAPIAWGRHYEAVAIRKYVSYMKDSVSVEKCGFIIHPDKGWIGASPDGRVRYLHGNYEEGILEVKCPFSKREVTPRKACADNRFYCKLVNSEVCLKPSHAYQGTN